MFFGVVVNAAGKTADRAFPGKAVEREINGLAAANAPKVSRNEHGPSTTTLNSRKYP
jgi:hypothetical protein